jgi:hypothetical protein
VDGRRVGKWALVLTDAAHIHRNLFGPSHRALSASPHGGTKRSTDDERTSHVLPETHQGDRCRRHSHRGRGRRLRHRERNRERRLSRCQHGKYDDGGFQPTVWTGCRGSVERSVWAGLRGNSRHGCERVQVDLQRVDISGQKVTVHEASSTRYEKGTRSASASAITTGEPVLVLGTTNGTAITATQVVVQPTGGGPATSSAVVPFQRGAPSTSKQVGQIPSNYSQRSGTIVSGTTANKATEAALAAYPGGIVDRVVKLSNGEYEVHNIGVNWPHHIFVNQGFKVVGAN